MRFSRNSLLLKHAKNVKVLSAIAESQFTSADNGYPWRDEDSDLFAPKSLDRFLFEELGIRLYPKQEEDLSAILGTDPKRVFDAGTGLPQQGILAYGKGSGKDFIVSCVMLWGCHVLLCLKNPARYLGQADGENIDVLTVAYSLTQATTVLFFKIKARLKACGWFRSAIAELVPSIPPERYLKDGNGFVGTDSIHFPGNLRLWSVPATDAAEGKNPILWAADEISAFSSPVRMNQAKHIYDILTSSARTRFDDRWKGFVISYPRHKEDFLMQLIRSVQLGQASDTYAVVRSSWEVNPSITRESLQVDYDRDPEGAACRYECKPPAAVDAYFRSPELLLLHASGAPIDLLTQYLDLPDDVLHVIAELGQSPLLETDDWGDPILDRRGFPKLAPWFRGQSDPSGQPYEYWVHVDLGLTNDAAGFAIGHLHQSPLGLQPVIDLAFRWTANHFREFGEIHRQAWFFDTVDQTELVSAAEIDIRTVREFLFFLRQARGFNLALVTFDGFNSAETMQELRKRDVPVGSHTVDKSDYDEFKGLVYDRRLRYYAYPILIRESYKLQIVNGSKVDAPRTKTKVGDREGKTDSHKDVSDAAAAIVARMARLKDESVEFYQMPPVESLFERSIGPIQIEASAESISAAQKSILQAFFDG
ncbi:hypothetical protein H6F43_03775 [Leptolyngbya sp. FACHB-36]|uniref:hypothetical protein n=1 Tax=Leptolyngbya sp. FACHB-36 TaxID=2692808 RepID=UPI0016818526|nr:hypothetical protein [Leptolyngbya sp. FACHB-36]MBD2019301.1 hypothetical protein [Leptolyngbya sp. FACHB-36]